MKRFIYTLFAVVLVLSLTLLPASPARAAVLYREHYDTGDDAFTPLFPAMMWCAQSFTAESNHSVDSVWLKLYRVGFPGTVTVSLRPTGEDGWPTDAVLASGTTEGNTLTTDNTTGDWREISLGAGCNVTFDTKYAIVWSGATANVTDYFCSREDASAPTCPGGCMLISNNSGATWTGHETESTDAMFMVCGANPPFPDEVWVDDTWLGFTPGQAVDGHTFGTDAFPTIQGGIDVVAAGGKVHAATGTYSEHVTIDETLTLQSGSAPVIDGGESGVAVTIGANNVTITGLTIQNADTGVLVTSGLGQEIHWCNIINHATWGLNNTGAISVQAKNNWWGDASGPYHVANLDGSGSAISGDVQFDPWLSGSLTNAKRQTVGNGPQTVDARTEADTVVDKDGPGTPTISVAQYTGNPGGSHAFSTIGKYIDVHIETPSIYIDVTWVRIKVYYTSAEIAGLDESSLKLYWWQPPNPGEGSWEECSNTGVDTTDIIGPPAYSGYIWAYINKDTTPNLAQLVGSAFGGGGAAAAAAAGIAAVVCLPKVINVTVTPTEVKPGEAVTITAVVKNMGDAPCRYTVKLKINGVVVQTKTITLAPWETKTVTFTVVQDEPGTYEVQVGDLKDEFIVSTPLSPLPASFKATSLSISPTKVGVGETVTISVLVNETGGGSGNYLVILKINGVVMGKQEVTLTPQQSQTVTFTITNQEAGIHKVEVNDLAGKFTVEVVPVEASPSSAQVINWWLIIGIIFGCLIIAVGILLTMRRRY